MILRYIFIFALLLISVYLGIYLQQNSSYILITLGHWTIETTLPIMFLVLLIISILIYFIFIVFNKIINIPSAFRKWRNYNQTHKSQLKTKQGLIEFNEGHWELAKKHLIDALPNADTPLLNYLTAARAAQEMGDNRLRDNYLREAQQSMPEAKVAVELTQAQLQLANNQWEQALATLKHLEDLSPKHPYVLKLLMQLYEEIRDWQQLIILLPKLKKYRITTDASLLKIQKKAYSELLSKLIKKENNEAIEKLMSNLPKELKLDSNITYIYTKYLILKKEDKKAETILYKFLQKHIDEKLLKLYGQINSDYIQLKFLESLLKNNNSTALNICIGKISLAKKLWGKAQSHFEESIKIHPTPEAYQELGKLFEQQNEISLAFDAYKKGLETSILLNEIKEN